MYLCYYYVIIYVIMYLYYYCILTYISVVYANESLSRRQQPIESCILLKTFLLLWKRLEVLKQHWLSNKLGISAVRTHRQYVNYWLVSVVLSQVSGSSRLGDDVDYGVSPLVVLY